MSDEFKNYYAWRFTTVAIGWRRQNECNRYYYSLPYYSIVKFEFDHRVINSKELV